MANNLIANWTFRKTLPEPFKDYTDDAKFTGIASKYCTQPRPQATLHAATLRAVLAYMELESPTAGKKPEELGAIGSQNNNFTIAEYPSKTGELHVVVYNRLTGKFYAGRYTTPPDTESNPEKYIVKEGESSGAALLFALLPTALADEECNSFYQQLKEDRDRGYPDMDETAKTAALLCDNIYRRITYGNMLPAGEIKSAVTANGVIPVIKPFQIEQGIYAPTNVIYGDFQVVKPGNSSKKVSILINRNDFVSKYPLSESRILTPQEELMVPPLPDWYIIPPAIKRICEHAKMTTGGSQPMRNFLLRGVSGTGKTEGAKALATALHLPYLFTTFSANSEIYDLLGQFIPDVDKPTALTGIYPTFQDILLDPPTAYYKLTGILDEDVTEEVVYQKLVATISEQAKLQNTGGTSQQRFKYTDTPLVDAIRNGYLIELQEPTVIANPGVLVGLNSLLDGCASTVLPNGEVIRRHPDTVIVLTTNNDYAGCKPLNQSIISRMNLVIDMEEPDEETLTERALAVTGCTDKAMVRTMVRIVRSMSEYCRANLITDGCCGSRELISWIQSYMICGDIREAARYTILASASADAESRSELESSCLDTLLAA
ncbi:MAG: AAA family ATPase [Eubacteriales bacterium]|nr:AAA family ATPase [Eubacteriales bacterium]